MTRKVYVVLALLMIGGYGYAGWRGLEPFAPATRGAAPQGVRGARPGGSVFWYAGYRGGK